MAVNKNSECESNRSSVPPRGSGWVAGSLRARVITRRPTSLPKREKLKSVGNTTQETEIRRLGRAVYGAADKLRV